MGSPDPRVVRQLRHDVDDVYSLLNTTNKTVATVVETQREHGVQLTKLQQTVDLHGERLDRMDGRLDRVETALGEILDLLRRPERSGQA
ncbi:hypothetical protein BKA01_004917 [Pseudonocardia eucalypti]|nr:hypothetical protein [Pseudonocardia eucalypti]